MIVSSILKYRGKQPLPPDRQSARWAAAVPVPAAPAPTPAFAWSLASTGWWK